MPDTLEMRAACIECHGTEGYRTDSNGQAVIRCVVCDRYAYNAPKVELGEEQRRVRTRPEIKPSLKARILNRDRNTCVVCHADDKPLHVGHMISVKDGREMGMTDDELYDEHNLAAMCEECNLGLSASPITLALQRRLFYLWKKRDESA